MRNRGNRKSTIFWRGEGGLQAEARLLWRAAAGYGHVPATQRGAEGSWTRAPATRTGAGGSSPRFSSRRRRRGFFFFKESAGVLLRPASPIFGIRSANDGPELMIVLWGHGRSAPIRPSRLANWHLQRPYGASSDPFLSGFLFIYIFLIHFAFIYF
jgi:hypothetical protein